MKHKSFISFTLMEILIGASIFVVVATMGGAIISNTVGAYSKARQQQSMTMAAQKVFDEIGKALRDGNPKKQVYICNWDNSGQLASPWWGGSSNQPPNDFLNQIPAFKTSPDYPSTIPPSNPIEIDLRYNQNPSGPFGEQVGNRRFGNVLQIVELADNAPADADIGYHSGWPIGESEFRPASILEKIGTPNNNDWSLPYLINELQYSPNPAGYYNNGDLTILQNQAYYPIAKITEFAVQYSFRNLNPNGPQPQITKTVINMADLISWARQNGGSAYYPCRTLAQTRWRRENLLPSNVRLGTISLEDIFGPMPPLPNGIDNYTTYFIVEGCDDLKTNTDGGVSGDDPGLRNNKRAYPDFNGAALSCLTSAGGIPSMRPIMRVAINLETGITTSPKNTAGYQTLFRTSYELRRQ